MENRWQLIGLLKLAILTLVVIVSGLLLVWQNKTRRQIVIPGSSASILTIPYQQTLYKHFGNAINPQIDLPVKTAAGYKTLTFLIDSGAVVSALPQTLAADLGTDITRLPRITIEGFAGQKTFAYKGEFVIVLGNKEVPIPVVFSENPQASNILGRIGFFDQFNIEFDADTKSIIITNRKG
ncbi:MAG TPA: aspartyl protease family protein [Patescibacteria group bacterium]|nr:aspartyl protease family protein [Patescibacteria group bacterium]